MTGTDLELLDRAIRRTAPLAPHPALDSTGRLILGFGHDCQARAIPEPLAHQLLRVDLADAERDAARLLPNLDTLAHDQRCAVIEIAYWLGPARLALCVNLLRSLRAGRGLDAAYHIRRAPFYVTHPQRWDALADTLVAGSRLQPDP